jgi:hypothetical protein
MNRRRFVSLIAATPIGIWATTKLGKVEPVSVEPEEEWDSQWDTQCVATHQFTYAAQLHDDYVLCGSQTQSVTLPAPEPNHTIMISAPHADVTVNGKWEISQGGAAMFASNGKDWFGIGGEVKRA